MPLITAGENLGKRRQHLAARRIGGAMQQHLDLSVVAAGGIACHPAAGLEMEVLEIIGGPLAAHGLAQHLTRIAILATAVNVGQILEEQARAGEEPRQRAVMVCRQRIDASLHIGKVLAK